MNKVCGVFFGLPGHGKSTLASKVADLLTCSYVNADWVRASALSRDLGFSEDDRIVQAKRMGALADLILQRHEFVVIDFICPTHRTRAAFLSELHKARVHPAQVVWFWLRKDRPTRFPDTKSLWQDPVFETYLIKDWEHDEMLDLVAHNAAQTMLLHNL